MQPQSKEHLEPPEAGRDKEGISLRSLRGERSPADTLILDFWPLELWDKAFLLFWVPKFVVVVTEAVENNTSPKLEYYYIHNSSMNT